MRLEHDDVWLEHDDARLEHDDAWCSPLCSL